MGGRTVPPVEDTLLLDGRREEVVTLSTAVLSREGSTGGNKDDGPLSGPKSDHEPSGIKYLNMTGRGEPLEFRYCVSGITQSSKRGRGHSVLSGIPIGRLYHVQPSE